jgi:methylglyoxal synthase
MQMTTRQLRSPKHIALIAHDHCKNTLIDWVKKHQEKLNKHHLYATGTTGHLLNAQTEVETSALLSGPMGGDQQVGAMIAGGNIDILIFFWDPLQPAAHDPDVKALLRVATLWNIPTAITPSTADLLMSSPLMDSDIEIVIPDYAAYLTQRLT